MSNVGCHFLDHEKLCLSKENRMKFDLECEREDDGRWLAEVSQCQAFLPTARLQMKQ